MSSAKATGKFFFVVIAIAGTVLAAYLVVAPEAKLTPLDEHQKVVTAASTPDSPGTSLSASTSPFNGKATTNDAEQDRYERRAERMRENGYGTPVGYFDLPLSKLQQMAQQGDMFALIQLGQQYWDEAEKIRAEPGFDASKPAADIAVQYMTEAVMHGATQPSMALAQRLAGSNSAEAYSWAVLAEYFQIEGAGPLAASLKSSLDIGEQQKAYASAEEKLTRFSKQFSNDTSGPR